MPLQRSSHKADTRLIRDGSGRLARRADRLSKDSALRPRHSRRRWLPLALVGLLLATLLQADWRTPPQAVELGLQELTAGQRFDLVTWEIDAVGKKLDALIDNPAKGLAPEEQQQRVRDYVQMARRAGELEQEIEQAYSNLDQRGAESATQGQRAQLAAMRQQLADGAPEVEAILESQVASQLDALGLTAAGLVWPPPRFVFTEPPQLLVVSPRERIERLRSIDLLPDLDSAGRDALERSVRHELGLSGYVTGIGGYGVWPTMVVDGYGLPWVLETIAHEWVHNYLAFHPLGWSFLSGGEAVTLNETVASIVGEEVGRRALETYYPDLAPRPALASEQIEPQELAEPPPFDFNQEMRATRLAVDAMLAQGQVDEAEAYMEERRQLFNQNGYRLRVLNQAYFAFHGSYATGAASTDPIGPKLLRLRELSPSLRAFLTTVDNMTSVADLDQALGQLEAGE